jgi:hypothetical protein
MNATLRYLLLDLAIPAGSALVILWGVLRFFGEKIFGHVLDRRLQKEKERHEVALANLKHEQDAHIEDLRAKIVHLTDRGKHSNQREYSDLSKLWEKFVDLYYATRVSVVAAISFPPLNSMNEEELAEFLDTTELISSQKTQIITSKDKERSFSRTMRWRYAAKARSEYYEFNLMLHRLGIFITKELKDQFAENAESCNKAIAQRSMELAHGRTIDLKHDLEFLRGGEAKLEALKDAVRERLLHE